MKHTKPIGYVMILTLVMITLAGMALIILNMGAKILLSESKLAYLEACDRNLAASGYAWANYMAVHKRDELSRESLDFSCEGERLYLRSLL